MAQRWYLARVAGTGTEHDPYRAVVHDHPTLAISAVIPTTAEGHPVRSWCIVKVDADDHAQLAAVTDVEALPAVALTTRLSSIPMTARQRMANVANTRLGTALVVGQGPMVPTATLRDVIQAIGRHLESGFDVTS